ncbi:gamma-glutamyltransferase family protein [Thiomonas sp. FB-6]|uniref:gamma-glutamyltransferase family protein n=1 Tax=Thiomonas sp. FB-6 TaxID=1158291 RepID=UPI0003A4C664|nr:gamma-glutamyltransferase family protein [Thiomonas sp. FB-6]
MQHTCQALGGMVVAPHHLAAQAGRDVLRDGGNAVEAMVAAAATIAVVYPHMNSIGGDGFWLVHRPGHAPCAIDASGPSASLASRSFYAGQRSIPSRGPGAALSVAGTLSGWQLALQRTADWPGTRMPLDRLLQDAIGHARKGIVVSSSQAELTRAKLEQLNGVHGFADVFLRAGQAPRCGDILRQGALADTLAHLARAGLDDFYRGSLAEAVGTELQRIGSPLRTADLQAWSAEVVEPLQLRLADCTIYNLPPSTQGLASLMILGIFERLGVSQGEGFAHVHGLVEATKRAFRVRNRVVTDPRRVPVPPQAELRDELLELLAADIDPDRALPWPEPAQGGDTVWMGAVDRDGCAVSFIQSVYWEFGSAVVLRDTGITWQNRGISFSLDACDLNALEPGRKPFHTLNPALALFDDGRCMPYGTMGGEGQPQTQAAVFTRYARFGMTLQQAIDAPRWLLGRTWGDLSTTLKLEARFDRQLVERLREAGHAVEALPDDYSDTMGHAGALVRHADGRIEGAADPRSDGAAAAVG